MLETLRIQEAGKGDRAFVVHSLMELQNHEAALHDTRRDGDRELCERYFEEISANAHNSDGALLVAYMNDLPVGFVCYWVKTESAVVETADSNTFGYISDVFVVDEYRERGFARHMFDEVQRRLKKNSPIRRLRICSLAANVLAVSAYDKAGFAPYEITFEKKLK